MALSRIGRFVKNAGRQVVRAADGLGITTATVGMAAAVGGLVLNDPSISKDLIEGGMAAVAIGGSGVIAASSILKKPWNAMKKWADNDPIAVIRQVQDADKKAPGSAHEALATRLDGMNFKQKMAFDQMMNNYKNEAPGSVAKSVMDAYEAIKNGDEPGAPRRDAGLAY